MRVLRRYLYSCISTVFALTTVACGAHTPDSPTSPTGNGNGASRAVITGTVMDSSSRRASSPDEFTTQASGPVTVSVVGTTISTVIDGSGRFQLTGVPPGDAQLRFTATGLDATLTLRGVQAGDRIDIRVRLTDTSIRLEAERRDRDDDDDDDDDEDRDDDEFEGTVSALSGTCPAISFTLNGLTVRTSAATRYDDVTCAQVRNTMRLEVRGRRQADGSVLADRIERED